jgi:hypothetical protein
MYNGLEMTQIEAVFASQNNLFQHLKEVGEETTEKLWSGKLIFRLQFKPEILEI